MPEKKFCPECGDERDFEKTSKDVESGNGKSLIICLKCFKAIPDGEKECPVCKKEVEEDLDLGKEPRLGLGIEYNRKMKYHPSKIKKIQVIVKVDADGTFGPKTTRAVMIWQKAHGLLADGKVGRQTLNKMGL